MSALARYFKSRGYAVAGYDRTPSDLTKALEKEGIEVTYEGVQSAKCIGQSEDVWSKEHCQVVYTPAVPRELPLFEQFVAEGYDIVKRSEMLGFVTRTQRALCVAGTHGKTTTSTILAHLMHGSKQGCNAFLGGISNNYHTNLLIDPKSDYVAVEADEYDRSFHRLTPYISVVTAADADHLDIYGTEEAYREAFEHYTSLIQQALVMKAGIAIQPRVQEGVKIYTYGVRPSKSPCVGGPENAPDFYAENIVTEDGEIRFDLVTPTGTIKGLQLGSPVWVNIENSVAAMAVALLCGATEEEIRCGLASYAGVYRRFDCHVKNSKVAYYDDYAHHPEELRASIASIRRLYPDRRLIGVFQPHLYTRTRDFAPEFAEVLSQLDETILLPIYPAREMPIAGVSSEMLIRRPSKSPCVGGIEDQPKVIEKSELVAELRKRALAATEPIVIITLGAGDIDRLVPEIKEMLCSLSY